MTSLEQKYQKKTDKEHVLDNPGTYTGSMEPTDMDAYVLEEGKIVHKELKNIIMGLYKLFDEAIVNCRDHAIRQAQAIAQNKPDIIPLTYIHIDISDEGVITFTNDGNGIDVAEHPTHKLWIPEMIFFHLRTGTNYDKKEQRIVGGQNGFGSKLIFIWSEWGKIETVDHIRKLKYVQECSNNLDDKTKPKVTKCSKKPYTTISFKPDYKRLGIPNLSPDMISLFRRRVYDIAAVTEKSIKVKYNGNVLPTKHFQQYVELYIGKKTESKRIYEKHSDRWEYVVCLSPNDEFTQVSFVNGIFTSKGGKHVEYVLNQIIKKIQAYILKKKKIEVKPTTIKEQLMLFLRCDINNPSFDSQTKDYMASQQAKFGTTCKVSDEFCEKIAKLGVMEAACELTAVKDKKSAKKTDGSKTRSIRGIPKLVDANFAGGPKSGQCTIILCEGDSAKAGIISGMVKEDRNVYGVYPMRGKLFNVRGENIKRISENKEIIELKKILGLETNKEYHSLEELHKSLRYGNILFMTDQDLDGSHIKGLGINLFQSQWKSLVELGIIGFMNTPILKATKGAKTIDFYNDGEYELWKDENEEGVGWKVKYYKGLGTSTGKEFKEYFKHKKIVTFTHTPASDDAIDRVFNKKRADDRKEWLGHYDRTAYLNTSQHSVSYEEFIDRELIHFSKYDCDRSIPNVMDGLKTSQRKILYAAFKKKLTTDIKVAQFSGYVSEHSAYHHGEASLNGAIVNMAQDFTGSNNIHLLMPNGQFGSRLQGGSDSASERYIFTHLSPLTRAIFNESDDAILDYLDDDGTAVEPIYYGPIIPLVLVNGAKGIGTGFSTDIMPHNPVDIIKCIYQMLEGVQPEKHSLIPYYRGFQGTITALSKTKFLIKGCYEVVGADKIRITELPIGSWTDDYKKHLENMIDAKKYVKDYNDMSTNVLVDMTVTFHKGMLKKLQAMKGDYDCNGLEKTMKMYTTNTNTNMHLFDAEDHLKKYECVEDIIADHFEKRWKMYEERKAYMLKILQEQLSLLSNKAKYIMELLDNTIDLRRKKQGEIENMLKEKGYNKVKDSFHYLIKMPMDAVSEENVEKIMKEKGEKEVALGKLKKQTIKQMWRLDLDGLVTML